MIGKYSILPVAALIIFFGCQARKVKNPGLVKENGSHYVEIRQKGIGMISLDKVPNEIVMKKNDQKRNSNFFSYAVGFGDSVLTTDPDKQMALGKYYQYNMANDWIAMDNGDSLRPVFFQPITRKEMQSNEGIIVFEVPSGSEPDTMFFMDSQGTWGKHQIILNK